MTIAMDRTTISSDRSMARAESAGGGMWVCQRLRGRVLTDLQAVNLMTVADIVDGSPPISVTDPVWCHLEVLTRSVGLSVREAVLLMGLDYDPQHLPIRVATPEPPEPPPSRWTLRGALATLGVAGHGR